MKQIILLILTVLLGISHALAKDTTEISSPSIESSELSPTQQWLELQRSGKSASSNPQPMSGEAMEKVHQRYIKSFEKPIPEFYEHEMPVTR